MSDKRLSSLKSLKTRIKKSTYLTEHYKEELDDVLERALEYKLVKPNLIQQISDRFYEEKSPSGLITGDLINLNTLNTKLTDAHKNHLVGDSFSSDFYPYFFNSYNYGVVVSQSCKLEHKKCYVVEICAVKPLQDIIYHLIPKASQKARDKFVYQEKEYSGLKRDYRELIDQQKDTLFYYPAISKTNKVISPDLVACLDIKIPIRAQINGVDNQDIISTCRLKSSQAPFRDKLGEKLGKFYSSVALEDTQELFHINDANFDEWIVSMLKHHIPLAPTGADKIKVRKFIEKNFENALGINDIWSNPDNLGKIIYFVDSQNQPKATKKKAVKKKK